MDLSAWERAWMPYGDLQGATYRPPGRNQADEERRPEEAVGGTTEDAGDRGRPDETISNISALTPPTHTHTHIHTTTHVHVFHSTATEDTQDRPSHTYTYTYTTQQTRSYYDPLRQDTHHIA